MSQHLGDPVAQLADAVRQAKPVAALLGTNAHAVSAAVDACLALLSNDPVRVVRVCGLPGTPLTLSRIVEEIGANHRGGPQVDDDELIVRVLATRSRGENQVVLLLEQAELLPLPTLVFLQVALTVFGTRTPRLQLLFAGHPKFIQLIDQDELTPLRDRLGPVIRVQAPLAGPELGATVPNRVELGGTVAKRRTVAGPGRRRWVFAVVPALMLGVAAAILGMDRHGAALRPIQVLIAPAPPAQIDPPPPAQPPPGNAQPPSAPALPPQAAEPEAAPAPASPEADVAVPSPSREPDVATAPVPSPPPGREPDVAAAPAPPQPPQPSGEPEMAALPAPSQSPPPSREPEVAAPPPPERRAVPSSEQLTRLRGEFDRFLSQTEWGSKKLSETERSRLFNEYLRWNYGTLAATPGTPP